MKRLLLILILAVVSSSAMAEWIKIANIDEVTGETIYAHSTTIRKTGKIVKMWVLYDRKTLERGYGTTPYMSEKRQEAFDCKKEKIRLLYFTRYPQSKAKGKPVVVANDLNEPWTPVAPGTINEMLWEYACGKR